MWDCATVVLVLFLIARGDGSDPVSDLVAASAAECAASAACATAFAVTGGASLASDIRSVYHAHGVRHHTAELLLLADAEARSTDPERLPLAEALVELKRSCVALDELVECQSSSKNTFSIIGVLCVTVGMFVTFFSVVIARVPANLRPQ